MLPNLVQCSFFRFRTVPCSRRHQTIGFRRLARSAVIMEGDFCPMHKWDWSKWSNERRSLRWLSFPTAVESSSSFSSALVSSDMLRAFVCMNAHIHMLLHNPPPPIPASWVEGQLARHVIAEQSRAESQVQVKSLLFLSLQAKSSVCQVSILNGWNRDVMEFYFYFDGTTVDPQHQKDNVAPVATWYACLVGSVINEMMTDHDLVGVSPTS